MDNFENCKITIFCNIDIRYFGKKSPKMPTNNNNDVNQQNILIKKRFYIPKITPCCNRIYSKFKTP